MGEYAMTQGPIETLRYPVRIAIDSCLLAAMRKHDRSALEELYLHYHPYLARFLARCTIHQDTIEEIIDDTFIALWSQTEHRPHECTAFTLILRVAYRSMIRTLQGGTMWRLMGCLIKQQAQYPANLTRAHYATS